MKKFSLPVISLLLCLSVTLTTGQSLQVDMLLSEMTLQQKVGQMFMVSFFGRPMNESARNLITEWQPGAVVLLKSNLGTPEQITSLTNDIQQTSLSSGGQPLFIAIDQEGGLITRLTAELGFTLFPVPALWTATGDADLVYRVGQALATEMTAVGINMNLAPVADLDTNIANPIIGRRSFGTYPEQVAPTMSAIVRGMQENGVLATLKHFPGHGDTSTDSHVELPVLDYDVDFLSRRELTPFMAGFDADVGATMLAHIWYPQLEPETNLPASLSYNIVTGLLRDELRYDGLIMPDAMDMDAIDTVYSAEESALMAVRAGHDVILMGANVGPDKHARAMQAVLDAVLSGDIDESRIDASVYRILLAKERYGVLNWQPLTVEGASGRIPLDEHAALIDELFRAGIAIVHDDNNLVPVTGNTAVIFPATQPSLWRACNLRDDLQPLGVSGFPSGQDIAAASATAQRAERVIVFTQNAIESIGQQDLVAALPPEKTIVVALQSPYDYTVLPDVAAYIVTYSPMSAAYTPICEILMGIAPAQGQMVVASDIIAGEE
ncbi:MAG: glycoside hydrolase family 3 protein [Aggregatilineales bacterium]